jgi:thymidylate synthase ThyX
MESGLKNLKHVSTPIAGGGEVIVLDTGAVINSEAEAMLQALHSRSTGGLKKHLEILEAKGAENFMANFYVGYGHKSIGDCGSTTIFIEGVSMLVAKAVQDWPLYSGQETSTRYVDFKTQPFKNPLGTDAGNKILEKWRGFYSESLEPVVVFLENKFPKQENEDPKLYKKAINARAFDILRSTLPAGATTNLAWHTNLRQAADKLMLLRHHPLEEVRNAAEAIRQGLLQMYPSSFDIPIFPETENYNEKIMTQYYYYHNPEQNDFEVVSNRVEKNKLPRELLEARPMKTELPRYFKEYGDITFAFKLDFGSFRDIQRHRAVTQRMPLLTLNLGFEGWYLEELPLEIKMKLQLLLQEQEADIRSLNAAPETAQYYIAMGYNTANKVTGDLGALLYLVELRSTRFVHPTLRKRALQMADYLKKEYAELNIAVHIDDEPNRFDIDRGKHDIELKPNA